MSDITVSSTTDTQANVNLAAGLTEPPVVVTEDTKPVAENKTSSEAVKAQPETESDSETEHGEQEQTHKGKGGFQKKIDKLTGRNYELEATLKQQNERFDALLTRLEAKPSAAAKEEAVTVTEKPTLEKFDKYEDYVEALADYKAEQRVNAAMEKQAKAGRDAKEAQTKQTEADGRKTILDAHNERVSAAREKYEDFDEVAFRADVPVTQSMVNAIFESDNGPDIMYHLGSNPDVAAAISKMSATRAQVEIGKLSAALDPKDQTTKTPIKKPTSTAPAPIKPVSAGSSKSAVPIGDLPYQEYKKARAEGRT